ncbi:MAG: tRNA 2-thiocytidine biosynthesis TtcA family protein [Clostridiales bacterium]|nr:tRNA 2-thiocytidine biosynthesis TtcA family protein [Clostridiales bacterium]MCD7826910.1 tRNA 2-thiocytidine biosynthesis TtcA family protein [Clostridiales bacterium]
MQKLMSRMRAAMEKYNMVQDGDKIAVGLSGGKDSVALLAALADMRRYYPQKFRLAAITVDMRFDGVDTDYSVLEELCKNLDVEYVIKRTELAEIVFNDSRESNPCSLCAKMRRGILHDSAKEIGCNKVALGHHMDDAVETFFMNLLKGGNIDCFCPVTYMSRKDLYVIRPMVLASEALVAGAVNKNGLPVVKTKCPADKTGERAKTKALVCELNKEYPALREKVIGALQRKGIDNW